MPDRGGNTSNQNIATVNGSGLATSLTEGTVNITATYQSIQGSTSLTATALTVQVSVTANDSAGHPLTYQWKSTDGNIQDVNATTTTWTLPDGPGIHFAYVLVSNGFGGYTERRIALNTDTIGTPLLVPSPQPVPIPPTPSTTQPANIFRGFLTGGKVNQVSFPVVGVIPGIPVDLSPNKVFPNLSLENTTTQLFNLSNVTTNNRGEFVFPNVDFTGGQLDVFGCFVTSLCGPWAGASPYGGVTAYSNVFSYFQNQQPNVPDVAGELLLADGSPCGTVNEFFGINSTATATLMDQFGNVLAAPVQVNEWGDYDLVNGALLMGDTSALVSLQCEGNSPVVVPVTNFTPAGTTDVGVTTVAGASAPVVTSMSATFNGTQVGQFLPPVNGAPSDIVPLGDAFLSEKGVDSRIGACQYYLAVGAVKSCDAAGNFSGAITFEDWKSQVKIDQYANPNPTNSFSSPVYTATYINGFDLNLARNHHSVSNGIPSNPSILTQQPYSYVGTYVCNHSGPSVLN